MHKNDSLGYGAGEMTQSEGNEHSVQDSSSAHGSRQSEPIWM